MQNSNTNDNHYSRHLFYSHKTSEKLFPFIPYAQYLIQKHCKEYWKNDKNDLQYVMLEIDIVLVLSSLTRVHSKEDIIFNIGMIAENNLKVSPLLLYNDPNVPMFDLNAETEEMKHKKYWDQLAADDTPEGREKYIAFLKEKQAYFEANPPSPTCDIIFSQYYPKDGA